MDTRSLKHFLSAYEHRNFMRASEELGLTKQGLSKSIANLEETIEAKLFVRSRTGAEPTEFGDSLASHARLILAETRSAEDALTDLKNADTGKVRLGVTPTLASEMLPEIVSSVLEDSPEVTVHLHTQFQEKLITALTEGEIDIVAGSFRPGTEIPKTINKVALFKHKDTVVCRSDHPVIQTLGGGKSKYKLANFEPFPWLVPKEVSWVVDKLNSSFQKAGIDNPRKFTYSSDVGFIRGLLAKSNHLCYGVGAAYSWEISAGLLSELFIPQLTEEREAVILTRKKGLLPRAAARLIDDLHKAVKNFS